MCALVAGCCGIGYNNQLPYNIPEHQARLMSLIKDKTIIIGRTTYDILDIPKNNLIVITKHHPILNINCTSNIQCTIESLKNDSIVIGGTSIFAQFKPCYDKLYITRVNHDIKADSFFNIKYDDYICDYRSEIKQYQGISYQFLEYTRKMKK